MRQDSSNSRADGDWFVRVAGVVGDFGNPFYGEERQRDVWNEASALGLQVIVWGGLLASTVLVWVVGSAAVPYALGFLALVAFAAVVASVYARRLGVSVENPEHLLRLRLIPYLAVITVLGIGVARSGAFPASVSFGVGLAVGSIAAVIVPALRVTRARRRDRS